MGISGIRGIIGESMTVKLVTELGCFNTEPILRITAEAQDAAAARGLIARVRSQIHF